jgi:hypothetical protein
MLTDLKLSRMNGLRNTVEWKIRKKPYKVELAELEKEIKDLLEVEVEFDFYQITIDDVSFEGRDVVKFMDLIKE